MYGGKSMITLYIGEKGSR